MKKILLFFLCNLSILTFGMYQNQNPFVSVDDHIKREWYFISLQNEAISGKDLYQIIQTELLENSNYNFEVFFMKGYTSRFKSQKIINSSKERYLKRSFLDGYLQIKAIN